MNFHPKDALGVSELPREPCPCNHFPPMVRDALVRASQTPITKHTPLDRIKAIDKAQAHARTTHPELFILEN